MLESTEDNSLAFFKSLILAPESINRFREKYFLGIEEAGLTTHRSSDDKDIIVVHSRNDFDELTLIRYDFKDFLQKRLKKEEIISIEYIETRALKILSSVKFNREFFLFIENTLIELNHRANIINYKSITESVIRIMSFFYKRYHQYHRFSASYLDTLEVYEIKPKKSVKNFTFNWREKNKRLEIEFLYQNLISADPPFIASSKETFIKAFSNSILHEGEYIKWLCTSVKNHQVISKGSLIFMLHHLFDEGYIKSDKNDFNKTCINVFRYPNGEKLKNIKGSKKGISKNPSRSIEINDIISRLSSIA
ncbi:MAG: hypothetical protein V7655_06390 [Aequorivita antarctica]